MAHLTVTESSVPGLSSGKKFDLAREGTTRIGKHDDACAIKVNHNKVGFLHCQIDGNAGQYFIKDHESIHGTTVNGARIDGIRRLVHNDIIALANAVKFYFTLSIADRAKALLSRKK